MPIHDWKHGGRRMIALSAPREYPARPADRIAADVPAAAVVRSRRPRADPHPPGPFPADAGQRPNFSGGTEPSVHSYPRRT